MIALPNYLLSSKIATPNKAETLKGVSPISSLRNVMVKVKDTASFIEAARAVHGDKYDYSLTDYVGSQKPITIICKKCGPFVLAEAGTHYWSKACGCRSCGMQESNPFRTGSPKGPRIKRECECGFVGSRLDFKSNSNVCKSCHEKQRQEKYTVKCKGCEKQISTSLNRPFCSSECRAKSLKSKLIQAECCNCGKSITKRSYRDTDKFCCSTECQIEWALKTNKGGRKADWLVRSKNAKSEWIKKRSKERIGKSTDGAWLIKCVRQTLGATEELGEWERRCNNSAKGLSQRLFGSGDKKRRKIKTFSELCSLAVVAKLDYSQLDEWSRKCYSTQKNMKWKRRLRNVKRHTSTHIKEKEPQLKQRSLWEWIEGQPESN